MNTGHFGLTLIRTDAIREMKRPFFQGIPSPNGDWGEGRVDDDIGLRVADRVHRGDQVVVTWRPEHLIAIPDPGL